MSSRCYDSQCDYEIEDLGDDAWLTGCAMCGSSAGYCGHTGEEADKIDRELDEQHKTDRANDRELEAMINKQGDKYEEDKEEN